MNENLVDRPRESAHGVDLALALVHHPVVNKFGDSVTSSITTLDAHDMARVCKTYGAALLYIVSPIKSQQRLLERVTSHWTIGFGADYNPSRKEALNVVKVVDSIDAMLDNFKLVENGGLLVATSAREARGAISYGETRDALVEAGRGIILFGTAHGLHQSVLERANVKLKPIFGAGGYNHLPVRCAAAVTMDRLFGG